MKTLTKLIFVLLLCSSCQSLKVAKFDSYSFEKTIELKMKTLALMDKSTERYSNNAIQTKILLLELQLHTDYEKSKAHNEITIELWKNLTNEESSYIISYFKLWKDKEKLTPEFIQEAKKQTNEAFDKIITLETKKEKDNGYTKTNFRHQKPSTPIVKGKSITSVPKN